MARGIYKRGEAQFLVRIRQAGRNISRTFETHEEAREWREVTVGQVTGRTYVDREREQRTTLKAVLGRYRDEVTPTKDGERQEKARLAAWMREDWAALPIASITPDHIVEWRARRLAEGKAPSTISNAMNLLSAVFKIAVAEWGYRVTNPCLGIRRPSPRPGREAHLSATDEAALLKACERGPAWLPWIVRLATETAMRQGELRRLRWEHIHPSHIHLPKVKDTSKRRQGRSRDVPLTEAAAAVVDQMRGALPRRLDGWVFGDPDAEASEGGMTEWMVQQAYADAVRLARKELGLAKHITFHDLRHVSTTRLAPLHRDALDLAKTTGHKTLGVLARYYNPTPEERAAEIRARKRALTQKSRRPNRMTAQGA